MRPQIPVTGTADVGRQRRRVGAMRPQIPVTGTRIRLIALWVLLAAAAAAAAYLVANWADRPEPLAGPVKGELDETPLDPEVLARPGVAEFRKLGGRIVAD